jgi:hypothetical protein
MRTATAEIKSILLILTEEFAVDLGSGWRWSKRTGFCLCPVTDVFNLKIHQDEVQ